MTGECFELTRFSFLTLFDPFAQHISTILQEHLGFTVDDWGVLGVNQIYCCSTHFDPFAQHISTALVEHFGFTVDAWGLFGVN